MVVKSLEMMPDRVRRARLPHRVGMGGVRRERARCAASVCPADSTTATACPRRSSRPRSRRRWASTTRTSRSTRRSRSSAPSAREELRDLSLEIYERAARIAEERGLILADTKFEFGLDDAGVMTLADEVLTSDSSRYWDAATWASGTTPAGADGELRQADRARLARGELGPRRRRRPPLPDEIVEQTAARYRELLERLTSLTAGMASGCRCALSIHMNESSLHPAIGSPPTRRWAR